MINCKRCGTEFEPQARATKLCSEACREANKRDNSKKWRTKTPQHKQLWASYSSKWREENYLKSRYNTLKARASSEGLPFDLELEDVVVPEVCPVLGIPLDAHDRDHQWSFDKVIPERGYVRGNVNIISMRANRLKNDASITELQKVLDYIKISLDRM